MILDDFVWPIKLETPDVENFGSNMYFFLEN